MWVAFSHLNENIKQQRRICSTETYCSLSLGWLWQEFRENPTAKTATASTFKKKTKNTQDTECKSEGGAHQPNWWQVTVEKVQNIPANKTQNKLFFSLSSCSSPFRAAAANQLLSPHLPPRPQYPLLSHTNYLIKKLHYASNNWMHWQHPWSALPLSPYTKQKLNSRTVHSQVQQNFTF